MRKWIERLVPPILYLCFAGYLLGSLLGEYDLESSALTPFYTNSLFVSQFGVFQWLSRGLMSCYAHPWLGTILTLILGMLLAYGVQGTLRLSRNLAPLCFIPSCLLLIPYISEGYDLYFDKTHGDEFVWLITLTTLFVALAAVRGIVTRLVHIPALHLQKGWIYFVSLAMLLGSGYYTYSRTYQDTNFSTILRMKHAVQRDDWEGVLCASREASLQGNYTPTRLQVLMVRLALQKTGRSGEDTYSYPDGDAVYNASTPQQYVQLILGPELYYQYGLLNFAYRWAMEDMVEYGLRPEYLVMMLKTSIMNGEKKLARRYADQLMHSPMYRPVAEHYLPYIDNPKLKDEDAEMQAIKPLYDPRDILDVDGGLVEAYLLHSFAADRGGNPTREQVGLDAALVQKSMPDFWPHFANLAKRWMAEGTPIPRHYQEAALLFAMLQGNISLDGLAIDPQLKQRFDELRQISTDNAQMGDEYNAQTLRGNYGDTYWYYFFFTKGLKTQ